MKIDVRKYRGKKETVHPGDLRSAMHVAERTCEHRSAEPHDFLRGVIESFLSFVNDAERLYRAGNKGPNLRIIATSL